MYEYIAINNPYGAMSVLKSYGLKIRDKRNLGSALRKLVAQEGEPALRKIADLHPDKELIMDVYSNADGGCNCGCQNKSSMGQDLKYNFVGADASTSVSNNQVSESTKLAMQTNAFLIVATIIIASAIITRK
jgi:hypothetical protein